MIELVGEAPDLGAAPSHGLDADELRSMPGAMGDALRAVQALPEVARVPFSLGGLAVRGMSPRDTDAYLDGVDLYNFDFWWESHEVFECFWRGARKTEQGCFFQALIQVAAANLKICMGSPASAGRLNLAAFERFQPLPHIYMGIDVRRFEQDMRAYIAGSRDTPARIRLLTSAD